MDIPAGTEIESTNNEMQRKNAYDKAQTVNQNNSSSTQTPQFEGSQGYQEAMRNSGTQTIEKRQPVVAEEKIGRNDACPCGSDKKYKHCHGK